MAILQVLGIMERGGPWPYREPSALHRFVEALRRSYADRAMSLGDPSFVKVPLDRLLSDAHVQELSASIDPAHATRSERLLDAGTASPGATTLPPESQEKKNTTHISVLDAQGIAVALTTTVNYAFGSCIVAKGSGVLLNDEMDDFAAQPMTPNVYGLVTGEANAIVPGKTPLSSMSPTVVLQKENPQRVLLVVGSPGGPTIPTTVLQVIHNVIDAQMDVVRAVGAGRIHHQYLPDAIMVDAFGLEPATLASLRAKGHQLKQVDAWGDAEAVMEHPVTRLRYSASDPRNEGAALGQD